MTKIMLLSRQNDIIFVFLDDFIGILYIFFVPLPMKIIIINIKI